MAFSACTRKRMDLIAEDLDFYQQKVLTTAIAKVHGESIQGCLTEEEENALFSEHRYNENAVEYIQINLKPFTIDFDRKTIMEAPLDDLPEEVWEELYPDSKVKQVRQCLFPLLEDNDKAKMKRLVFDYWKFKRPLGSASNEFLYDLGSKLNETDKVNLGSYFRKWFPHLVAKGPYGDPSHPEPVGFEAEYSEEDLMAVRKELGSTCDAILREEVVLENKKLISLAMIQEFLSKDDQPRNKYRQFLNDISDYRYLKSHNHMDLYDVQYAFKLLMTSQRFKFIQKYKSIKEAWSHKIYQDFMQKNCHLKTRGGWDITT